MPRRSGLQASSPAGSPSLGRYTRKSLTELNVASARSRHTSSVNDLSYSLTELSLRQCLMRTPSSRCRRSLTTWPVKLFGTAPLRGHVPTQEAHHVGAAEGGDGVLQQSRVQPPQLFGRVEAEVDRPLTLI